MIFLTFSGFTFIVHFTVTNAVKLILTACSVQYEHMTSDNIKNSNDPKSSAAPPVGVVLPGSQSWLHSPRYSPTVL